MSSATIYENLSGAHGDIRGRHYLSVSSSLLQGKVEDINPGRSYIKHIAGETITEALQAQWLSATTDFARVAEADAVIICVPTPLNKNREPDISYILETGRAIAPHLRKGTIVVLESTTYPGTTDTDLREVIEANSTLKAGSDFHLAFSPEREDPGNPSSVVATIPKVVGGYTPEEADRFTLLFRSSRSLAFSGGCAGRTPSGRPKATVISRKEFRDFTGW